MAEKHRPSKLQLGVALAIACLILGLQIYALRSLWSSSGRAIGVYLGLEDELQITQLLDGGPAQRAGLKSGDRLLAINGYELKTVADYDSPASHFERGEPVTFEVLRNGETIELTVRPGITPNRLPISINFFVLLVCLALGLLTFVQSGHDLRGRLLSWFFFLLAFELAFTQGEFGTSEVFALVAEVFFYVFTGAQLAVELHLASLIPERQRWLHRHRWAVPAFYVIGLGLGTATATAYVLESMVGSDILPWSYFGAYRLLMEVGLPVWATAVLVLLGLPAFRHPDARGRQQALLILLGVAPWIVYIYYTTTMQLLGKPWPLWLNEFFPLIILCFPVAVFVAIYRYHLFDIELVVRRSLIYTALTSVLVAVFYAVLGLLGLVLSRVVGEDRYSIWAVAAAMFLVGLLFGNVRRGIQNLIDRLFFPERRALRQRLVELSAELPSLGNVSAMGSHLVERLVEIFGVRQATLFLADPKAGRFFTVASHPAASGERTLSSLVAADDPALERLRDAGRALPAAICLSLSPVLSRHFSDRPAGTLVPLLVQERMVGFVVLAEPDLKRQLRREELELLSLLAHNVAVSFENIRLFESATYESLTGLLRRGAILDLLAREIERAQRYGRPLVAGMADLDFFKSVNDRYGHLAGDVVLKRVSEELQSGLRSTDAIGRYGGEEFLLVLPETGLDGGLAVAEKLRRCVESLELPMSDGTSVAPRISIGLAALEDAPQRDAEESRRALIDAADRALYQAKERGRNRVETHGLVGKLDQA